MIDRKSLPVSGNYLLLQDKAKEMRNNPTPAEAVLWKCLKNKELGIKFRRQHIIDEFIVDFVNLETVLIIEVDGGYHNKEDQKISDQERTEILERKGFKIIRFLNEEVLFSPEEVCYKITVFYHQLKKDNG